MFVATVIAITAVLMGIIIPDELFDIKQTITPIAAFTPVSEFDRHDPSNIIRFEERYWMFYTVNVDDHREVTVHAASSPDGYDWDDHGLALGPGIPGAWDESGVIAPYVAPHDGKFYLFYTGFRSGDLATRDLGVAVSAHPLGPWTRWGENPVLRRNPDPEAWDSGMLGDSNVIYREGRWWLYFKSRRDHETNLQTRIGVATATHVTGPFEKHEDNPLFAGHAFSAWVHRDGVAALCGVVSPSVLWSADGLHFKEAGTMPNYSTGFYCPENFSNGINRRGVTWGVDCYRVDGRRGLHRFDCTMGITEHNARDSMNSSDDTANFGSTHNERAVVNHTNLKRGVDKDNTDP